MWSVFTVLCTDTPHSPNCKGGHIAHLPACSLGLIHIIACTHSKTHQTFRQQNEAACLQFILSSVTFVFLSAGCFHLDTSLRPHILTLCKHVWLYQLTFLPSGHSMQAKGRHATLMFRLTVLPQETLAMSSFQHPFPHLTHYYCHILFFPFRVKRLVRAEDFPLFLSHQCHISLFDFLAFAPFWSSEVLSNNYKPWQVLLVYWVSQKKGHLLKSALFYKLWFHCVAKITDFSS